MAGNADSWVLNESLVHSFLHSSFVNRRSVKPMHHTASRLWLTSFALLGVVGLLGSFLNNHRGKARRAVHDGASNLLGLATLALAPLQRCIGTEDVSMPLLSVWRLVVASAANLSRATLGRAYRSSLCRCDTACAAVLSSVRRDACAAIGAEGPPAPAQSEPHTSRDQSSLRNRLAPCRRRRQPVSSL